MKKYIILASLCLVGCSNFVPYVGTRKQLKEFSVNGLQIYLITNREQFPVTPKNPETVGLWLIRYGLSEEIWVCAQAKNDVWTPEPGILEHELLHALHHRDRVAIQDPDRPRRMGEIEILHETAKKDLTGKKKSID